MLTQEQLELRRGKITSSTAGAALGMNKYMTPLEAWLHITGRSAAFEGNKATDRGNRVEDVVLDYPCDVYGLARHRPSWVAHSNGWSGDNVDALYTRIGESVDSAKELWAGEGKSAALGAGEKYGKEGTDDIPQTTLIQSMWHLIHWPTAISCYVPVLVGGYQFEFRCYNVSRDNELAALLQEQLEHWHRVHVIGDRMPEPLGRDADLLANMVRADPKKRIPATVEISKMIAARAELERQLKAAKEAVRVADTDFDALEQRLLQLIGDASEVAGDGWTLKCPTGERRSTSWKAVAEELGAPVNLVTKHTSVKPTRAVSVKYAKGAR